MAIAWVLVANQSHARLFEAANASGDLHEVEGMIYPEARMKGTEVYSDGPGRSYDSGGEGRHGMGNPRELHNRAGSRFAKELAHTLERGRQEGRYEKLYIVAEPQMVGNLREELDSPTRATIAGETGKNLVSSDAREIRSQLPYLL
ncbi:host attachment protein [Microbulbifer yueqingensis]|uniref:Protein required for attachment to host cells n=1 Tax=Microbulbifer yueqingensis TaxID=658219 RepID=A0A1G8XVM0_9GAMM|nr:host attachment protein [Microbulbifer yueqingensis]SDJ94537.1 Protein required for attachment to host cells [Microbulbifer yueqingensis]